MKATGPWVEMRDVIEPHYLRAGNGCLTIGLERMPLIHFIQDWFKLADLAFEATAYDSGQRA